MLNTVKCHGVLVIYLQALNIFPKNTGFFPDSLCDGPSVMPDMKWLIILSKPKALLVQELHLLAKAAANMPDDLANF